MITRTSVNAEVKATIVEKVGSRIQSREVEVTINKCTSPQKAEIVLSKMFKTATIQVDGISFFADKRVMSESDFEKYSTLKEHTALTPEEIEHINESRKRGNR